MTVIFENRRRRSRLDHWTVELSGPVFVVAAGVLLLLPDSPALSVTRLAVLAALLIAQFLRGWAGAERRDRMKQDSVAATRGRKWLRALRFTAAVLMWVSFVAEQVHAGPVHAVAAAAFAVSFTGLGVADGVTVILDRRAGRTGPH
ncbi:hypothetical protein [Curtobacterium sp. MCBD17_040]|uniref:hypothetical protein n=1 Tax=Curtobacterium sp. MCBD17_040 TaxID=2175674 RepID=UPI000DA7174F|nr:hypothetical protein [Curtobacterium sp. MCBD17_040]WIB65873.1 hypothetical protein DEI94_17310 [Curtobacterium sp. MCBD17_040]